MSLRGRHIHARSGPNALSVVQVCKLWDILIMGRVEDHAMQCGSSAPNLPLPVEMDETELLDVSVDLGELPRAAHRAGASGRHGRVQSI